MRSAGSRFAVLVVLASACATSRPLNPAAPTEPVPAPRVAVDTHLHVTMSSAAKPLFRGEPDDAAGPTWTPNSLLANQIDSRGLRESGLRLAIASVWPPYELRPGKDARANALDQLEGLQTFARRRPAFAITLTSEEAKKRIARGYIALVPGVEGGEGITSVEDVDLYYAAGARLITLTHFVDNALGGAAKGQVAKVFGMAPGGLSPKGLSPLGREVVMRMIRLGIIIDLAHASQQTMREVLEIAEREQVPVVNSHAGAFAYNEMERNLSDELAARTAKTGGTLGVTLFRNFVKGVPDDAKWPDYQSGTCDDVVAHWLRIAKAGGAENVVLGSDFNGFILRSVPGGLCPHGLRNTGDLRELWTALEAKGIPHGALDGMGDKFLSVMEKVEAKADPVAQAQAKKKKLPYASAFDVPL